MEKVAENNIHFGERETYRTSSTARIILPTTLLVLRNTAATVTPSTRISSRRLGDCCPSGCCGFSTSGASRASNLAASARVDGGTRIHVRVYGCVDVDKNSGISS